MDNPTTLLVAIMYVTIVVTGIVNILMFLSELFAGNYKTAPVHTNWITYLLVAYLNFFWHTTLILEIEGWNFLSFIGFVVGPIVLLFATNLIVAAPADDRQSRPDQYFYEFCGRFFLLLCAVQIWMIGLDIMFESVGYPTYLAGFNCVLFLILAISKNFKVHIGVAGTAWLALLIRVVLQSL